MVRCIQYPFIVLLIIWRSQHILGQSITVHGTICVGNNITVSCTISDFTTVPSATWSRNGSSPLTTCTNTGFCTTEDQIIDGIRYSFTGDSGGIQVSFQTQPVEDGIEWICTHNAINYRKTINVLDECSSGGGSAGLTDGQIVLIVLAVLAVVTVIILCCILNTRCKFGDVCKDSKLSFTFPPGNGRKVNTTPKGSKENLTPKINPGNKEVTPNKGSKDNLTPKSNPGNKEVTPNQEAIISHKLYNEKSSKATIPQRTGAFQQLNPLNKGEGRNGNGEDLPNDETKYDESKKTKREEK